MDSLHMVCDKKPDWMPEDVWQDMLLAIPEDGVYRSEISKGERQALKVHRQIPVSEWAEKYRVLETSSIRGKWQNLFTPYLVGIMDATCMPGVETVILCKSPQTGGSEAGHNLVGYCVDRLPGPTMYVFPDENTARENAQDRIIPMLTSSPRLRRYLTGLGDDVSSGRIKLIHMTIYLAWSGSVSRLGNKPIRILILDELDKYSNPKNEAKSEDLAEKRTTTWRSRRKIFKISTPTTEDGPIWQAYTNEANARFLYYVKCPDCGAFHVMEFERINWPHMGETDEPLAEEVMSQKMAYYVCPECGSVWDDSKRDMAVRAGHWREEVTAIEMAEYIRLHKPQKIAFHIPAWLSYFVSLSEVARAWLKFSQNGSMNDFKNFQNQYLARPWYAEHERRRPEELLKLCDDRPRGRVPGHIDGKSRVACLLAGVDTQKRYFRYVIRAFGIGETQETWLIQEGVAPSFEALEEILFNSEYTSSTGERFKIRHAIIDAMGDKTAQVYSWCVKNRGRVHPAQGVHRLTGAPWKLAKLEYFPSSSGQKPIPGGLQLFRLDATYYKNLLVSRLAIAPEDPGAFHLHVNDRNRLKDYAAEMCVEVWDPEKAGGTWTNEKEKPNHAWDCEYLLQALADIMEVKNWKSEDNGIESERPRVKQEKKVVEKKKMSIQDRLSQMRRVRSR